MIVLLTDFGCSEYVGVMKAVMHRQCRTVQVVDLCHSVSPQSVIEASWILKNNYKYFPRASVFCCVVDPDVGTDRRAIAVKTHDYYFVAPDNGLVWEAAKEEGVIQVRQIYIPDGASKTFHGRDVFAPAAAKIKRGRFSRIGDKVESIKVLELYRNDREGLVVRIDHFGNIITNVPGLDKDRYTVKFEGKSYKMCFYPNYQFAKDDELFLTEGSCNTLEISMKNGSAVSTLAARTGFKITIR